VTVRSLHDGVDTSTSTGRMVAGILMSIAEYERELVRERTALKLEHARIQEFLRHVDQGGPSGHGDPAYCDYSVWGEPSANNFSNI
jgi:hypothetical protein